MPDDLRKALLAASAILRENHVTYEVDGIAYATDDDLPTTESLATTMSEIADTDRQARLAVSETTEFPLTDEQRAVCLHAKGPSLVIAGAGTGKTRTASERVRQLIQWGEPAASIMLLTFTNAAAREMIQRVAATVGTLQASCITAGTFHSVAMKVLRQTMWQGITPSQFEIISPTEELDILRLVRADQRNGDRKMQAWRLIDVYDAMRIHDLDMIDAARQCIPETSRDNDLLAFVCNVVCALDTQKRNAGKLDFTDLLVLWLRALEEYPECCGNVRHLIVDEAQDMDGLQHRILNAMMRNMATKDCMLIGDAAQSIYGWRGSDVHAFDQFAERTNATIYKLSTNFRSKAPITDIANAVLENADIKSVTKLVSGVEGEAAVVMATPEDESEEADVAANVVRAATDAGLSVAVLSRTSSSPSFMRTDALLNDLPHSVRGGKRISDRTEVMDAMAFFRFKGSVMSPWSLARLLRTYDNIGDETATNIVSLAQKGYTAVECLTENGYVKTDKKGIRAASVRAACADLLAKYTAIKNATWPETMTLCCDYAAEIAERLAEKEKRKQLNRRPTGQRGGYLSEVDKIEKELEAKRQRLAIVRELAQTSESEETFADTFALESAPTPTDDNLATLSTIHSAKGLEWDVVVVLDTHDANFPGRDMGEAAEESRRCLYVAVTRAKSMLVLLRPETTAWSKGAPTALSRYLLPAARLDVFKRKC
jgi:DNA helicase-2/ATP-dependent DNA helicase PcrA